ncbi:MAG: amino acid deaminase/aldolase [Clostridia bacterium]
MREYGYYQAIFSGIPKPFAFLDLDLLDDNIATILEKCNDKTIRIASKSLRSIEVLRYIQQQSERFAGIMCFSGSEAVFLAEQGFDDLLLGYPIWDAEQLAAIARLVQAGHSITLMVDCTAHVDHVERIARAQGTRLPLCVDIDMSMDLPGLHFGVWRSPVRTPTAAIDLISRIAQSDDVFLDGLMGYEAQIAGVGDHYPGKLLKNGIVRFLKQRSIHQLAQRRAEVVAAVQKMNIPIRFVNGGGTGSLNTTVREQAVTELTVGSGFYSPALFDNYKDFRYQPAAGFAIEIVRKPSDHLYTCTGGGYIASGAVGGDKQPVPYLPAGARLIATEGAGEVQTPIHYQGTESLGLGDPIFMRHSKAGELCERFTRLICVSQGKIVGEMATYRGSGQCFL